MYSVIILPFLFGCIWLVNGVNLGRVFSSILSNFLYFFVIFVMFFFFFDLSVFSNNVYFNLLTCINLGFWVINLELNYDVLNYCMLFLVFFISIMVMLYSWDYMEGDPLKGKFMGFLGFFTFFMLLLVTSGNLFLLFIGWEGVGLSSYLLISFWFIRLFAVKAAVKAMIINRIGDIFLLFACIFFLMKFNSLNFSVIKGLIFYVFELTNDFYFLFFEYNLLNVIGFFLFIGAMSKSAQFGLHTWLPDAMEGPTPVSALIHAATMVTAGVFLVIRFSFLFEFLYFVLFFIVVIGFLTSFFAALFGVFQYDIKKIVAYSTCSQLGYMFFSCGFSNYSVAFFHLINHGFFKALLFLSMGSIIHALVDEQDLRKMGNNLVFLNFTYLVVFIGSFALLGLPFFAGFYSKDLLLELVIMRIHILNVFVFFFGIFGAFFTAFYSLRLIIWVFFVKYNGYRSNLRLLHESVGFLFLVLFILGFFSIFVGYFFYIKYVGIGSLFFNNIIFVNVFNFNYFSMEFGISSFLKLLPLIFTLCGLFFYLYVFFFFRSNFVFFLRKLKWFVNLFYFTFFFDNIYHKIFFYFMHLNYYFFFKYFEKIFFDWFGFSFFFFFSNFFNRFFNYIFSYFFFHLVFMILFLILFIYIFIFFFLGLSVYLIYLFFFLNLFIYFFKN